MGHNEFAEIYAQIRALQAQGRDLATDDAEFSLKILDRETGTAGGAVFMTGDGTKIGEISLKDGDGAATTKPRPKPAQTACPLTATYDGLKNKDRGAPNERAYELGTCVVCSRQAPRPILTCMICTHEKLRANEITNPPTYCDTACQAADQKEHGSTCLSRKVQTAFQRAGQFLQGIYYVWREALFNTDIESASREFSGRLAVYGPYKRLGKHVLTPFPDHLVKDNADKQVLLTYLGCRDVSTYFLPLIQRMLQGYYTCGEEVDLRVKRAYWQVVRHFSDQRNAVDGSNYRHELLVLEAINNRKYVFDLSGAQYGNFQPVWLYEEYQAKYVDSIIEIHPLGTSARDRLDTLEGKEDHKMRMDFDMRHVQLEADAFDQLSKALSAWETSSNTVLTDLLHYPQASFENAQSEAIKHISKALNGYLAHWAATGHKLNPRGSLRCSTDLNTKVNIRTCLRFKDLPPLAQNFLGGVQDYPQQQDAITQVFLRKGGDEAMRAIQASLDALEPWGDSWKWNEFACYLVRYYHNESLRAQGREDLVVEDDRLGLASAPTVSARYYDLFPGMLLT